MDLLNPPELGQPSGWTNGVVAPPGGRLLFIAGQTAADASGRVSGPDFASQFDEALRKILTVVEAAGGRAANIARMTVYVSNIEAYREARARLGDLWKARMGRHYPAMTLVEVARLLDAGAMVEIEATAVLPPVARD